MGGASRSSTACLKPTYSPRLFRAAAPRWTFPSLGLYACSSLSTLAHWRRSGARWYCNIGHWKPITRLLPSTCRMGSPSHQRTYLTCRLRAALFAPTPFKSGTVLVHAWRTSFAERHRRASGEIAEHGETPTNPAELFVGAHPWVHCAPAGRVRRSRERRQFDCTPDAFI